MPAFLEPERRCQTTYDAVEKIWSGIKAAPIYGPECSIGKAVLEALLRDPEHISQIFHRNGKVYTNKDIANLSIRVAQHFQKLGVQQSEMIGIVAGNAEYMPPLVFGAMLCGLTICPVESVYIKDTIKDIYALTKPKIIFTVGSSYHEVKESIDELNLNSTIYTLTEHVNGVPEITDFLQETGTEKYFKPEALQYGYTQIAAVLRSSGTSGTPKAVCLTHGSLLNTYRPKFERSEIFLRNLSIHWVSGLSRLIGCCLQGVTSIIYDGGFKSFCITELMEKYGITFIYSTPHLLIHILQLPNVNQINFSSLRQFHVGGCSVPYTLIEKAKKVIPKTEFRTIYGSSELCGTITIGDCNNESHVGQLVPNMQLKIVDEQQINLGIGEVGEICLRTIYPWPGYYKNPGLTAASIIDGWIYSGDLGYINEEGNLFILDRKKNLIQYMEHQIYPNELEMIIAEIPGVTDVCVCGVSDGKAGQLPAAAVCKSEGSNLTTEEIYDYVAERVEDFKNLRGGIHFTSFIPKTSTGKKITRRATDVCEVMRAMKNRDMKMNTASSND